MYKVQSHRLAMRPRQVDSRAETGLSHPSLSRTPEELNKTPMLGSRTLQSLNKHQGDIRRLHKAFLGATDPRVKKLIGNARDRLLSNVKHASEDRLHPFIQSMIQFNRIMLESDDEIRRLDRAHRESPGDEFTLERLNNARVRSGKPALKSAPIKKARGRLAVVKKAERKANSADQGRGIAARREQQNNTVRFALGRYHAAARLGMERAKRGMLVAGDENTKNNHKEAHDRYKRALLSVKQAKKVHRGDSRTPGAVQGHLRTAHQDMLQGHRLSGLKQKTTGKKYFPGAEF